MKCNKYLYLLITICCFVSCKTSKTFYGDTYSNLEVSKKVYRLDLSNYKEEIDLSHFDDLRMLNLSNIGNVEELEHILNTIPVTNKLKILILDNNNLKKLPTCLSSFKNLDHLSLNNNPELDLSNSFEQLSKLKLTFLNLQSNQLTTIPSEIKKIVTLKELNISNNKLLDLDLFDNLCQLPLLRSLWLRNNNIEILNPDINKMSQLVNLYLEKNQLGTLPKNLNNLKSLRVLHLSFNKFKELPLSLQTIPKVILLHIDHCKIDNISKTFNTKTTSIKGIVINDNQLSDNEKKYWKSEFKNFFLLIF